MSISNPTEPTSEDIETFNRCMKLALKSAEYAEKKGYDRADYITACLISVGLGIANAHDNKGALDMAIESLKAIVDQLRPTQ